MRRLLPVAVALIAGWVVLMDMMIAPAWLGSLPQFLLEAALVLGAFALLFGTAHLAATHGVRVAQGQSQSSYGAVLVLALVVTFVIGVAFPGSRALSWIFRYLYTPLQATMLGLMTFVLVGAVYRVGRLKRRGAGWLVGVALVLLLVQVLASDAISPLLPALRDWIMAVPVTAGARGILLGIALGATAAGLRILFGIEHPYAPE
ncbi:MAG: hypothetical protein R6X16_02395 [Anaerolineae bacterium]